MSDRTPVTSSLTVNRKALFQLPEDMIYLDGNSLGPLPIQASQRISAMVEQQWGQHLITGWNADGWMQQPSELGNSIATLIGAPKQTVMLGDTLSIKVFQALSAALQRQPTRRIILSDTGNFPTDLYMAQGLIDQFDSRYEIKLVPPDNVLDAIDESVAVVMLTHVDYCTGRMHDMDEITRVAHDAGAVMLWDLAHSAGAVCVDLAENGCEFAVGCTYKYLNGGPGAPAFIYVRQDIIDDVNPTLSGWLGHDAPFAFETDYRPGRAIERMRVGTPPVIQMAALEAALEIWEGVSMADVRRESLVLSELFIAEVESKCPELTLLSPRDGARRGSQVSFAFEHGYAAMQALIERKVIGDFRQPNIMRFGFTPLFIDKNDVLKAVDVLEEVLKYRIWDAPRFHARKSVT